ncbi:disulfide bond formation protein DsbB [Alteromonas lipotrueiana]|uniref:disulfide bond formation protein DsbB n=1 Tax=Alteromonas lipotrueiana TaxID=2803815 RepID=UPI001C490F15|nr:disulfide bond formation protein DsbB [Alteromonas lipotrueiana]|tara:strand:- start:195 stop:719 length:525 start_codon:yes stop_codon:yes gene_type:complete
MSFIQTISRAAAHKGAWLILFLSALALEIAALYFQYGLGLAPCIMCIYQRTAMYGIVLAGLLVVLINHSVTRFLGFTAWLVSAGWGWLIASEHVEILHASNPFFASCEIVPNFPAFMPLHEWLPAIFAAKGDCMEDGWRFMSMGMAEWMMIIFAAYFITGVVVLTCRLIGKKAF